MPELPLVQIPHGLIQRLQEFQSARRDARLHHAAVILLPFARDQPALFHAVQQPRDIWIVSDHAVANPAASQSRRPRAAQDAQHVVLRAGQLCGARQLLGLLAQRVRRLQQSEENALFQGCRRALRLAFVAHKAILVV